MILTQFHIFLLVAVMMAIFYIGFICGNYDRRMPKMNNEDAMDLHTMGDEDFSEMVKEIKNKTVAECDECVQPLPF